jgi:hypothetical protein
VVSQQQQRGQQQAEFLQCPRGIGCWQLQCDSTAPRV